MNASLIYVLNRFKHYQSQLSYSDFFPFLTWKARLTPKVLRADLIAGLTGAILVLPQGVAYALLAGLPPEYGLYAAIIPTIIAALFGSSWHVVSGSSAPISMVVFAAISPYALAGSPEFIELVLTLTLLVGIFQLLLGLARLGTLVNFISHSVVVGFTAGVAFLITTSQLKNIFSLNLPSGLAFFQTWWLFFSQILHINLYTALISFITVISALLIKKYLRFLPNMLIALIIGSYLAFFLNAEKHGIQLIGSIPAQLPPLSFPHFSLEAIKNLVPSAMAIALLGLIQASSIAKALAIRSHQVIDGNQEFIGQGLSNIIGAFFSGYASSGSLTRSGMNYDAGAQTPMAAVFSAIILAIIILILAPLTAFVPLASMSGLLLIICYHLIEFKHIQTILKASPSESVVLIATFLATLFLELEFAIYTGILLSLIFYLNKTSNPNIVTLAPDPDSLQRRLVNIVRKPELHQCPQLKIIRIDGSLFFGATTTIQKYLLNIKEKYLLIVCSAINFIDVGGAEILAQEAKRRREMQGGLFFSNLKLKASETLRRGEYLEKIGEQNIFLIKPEALKNIVPILDKNICAKCPHPVFMECPHRTKD